jgi:heat shock protein HtpX
VIRRSFVEVARANRRASFLYGIFLVVLLASLSACIVGYLSPEHWPFGAAGGAALGLLMAAIARFAGSSIVLAMSGAREASPVEDRVLDNVAEEMAIAAGIPKPKVMIIDDSAPNAFATGPDPQRATVVFTTGIIEKLDRDELQGVMAHEIAHIRNYDIRFMTTIALIAGLIPLLADGFRRMAWHGGRSRKNDGAAIFLIVGLILSILAPIFSHFLEMAVSRKRELLADATAAELTRYPWGLASALEKISRDTDPLEAANHATQHMYIVNPFRRFEDRANALFSTHPPTEERIRALRGLMGAGAITGMARRAEEAQQSGSFEGMPEIPDPAGK